MKAEAFEKVAQKIQNIPQLREEKEFLLVALNRAKVGMGDDGALVRREGGGLNVQYRKGIPYPESERFVYLIDDDPYEDCEDGDEFAGSEPYEEDYGEAEAYRIQGLGSMLYFHKNRTGDGIRIKEDLLEIPIVYWNAGKERLKVDGHWYEPKRCYVVPASAPERAQRRAEYEEAMAQLMADTNARLQQIERTLLALGCPAEDAHVLATYFWAHGIAAEEYPGKPHTVWMDESIPVVRSGNAVME